MKVARSILLFIFLFFVAESGFAQCSMCRRVAETSNEAKDNKAGGGLNKGILYLLSIPYLLGGVGVYFWYKNRDKN